MEKRLVPDLHLEELLIPGGQLLGPGAERQQQQQERQRAAQQEHPAATTGSPTSGGAPRAAHLCWNVGTPTTTPHALCVLQAPSLPHKHQENYCKD